ncbi:hexokinase type 2 [Zeugodacus cucurbitae]|uniref:hexokinase type 2 n=1 Tax=Zeugodacus cucurbitae TaxID=28588 RepID=UPI0023D92C80|nr:hexokinase type 2 [Zeugodacus cucurbitae]
MQDQRLKDFLKEFIISDSQLQELYKRFTAEIQKGLTQATHQQADIKCYMTYVQDLPTGDEQGNYLALDLGGTNFRVLRVSLQGHHEAEIDSKVYVVDKELMTGHGTKLFDHIANCLAEFVNEHSLNDQHLPLGFTFSFPCIQLGLTKALLTRWTKGFQCAGVEQEDVGRLLKEAIARRGDLEIDVMALLNDTTGTLMSCAHRNPECRIGVIIGTGCNACYVERVENADLLEPVYKIDKPTILVNTEWGAFGESGKLEFVRTDYDRKVDKDSLNAGSQLFEKMISGMYLGELVRLVLADAIAENLIFARNSEKERFIQILKENTGCIETRFISEIENDTFPAFQQTRKILKDLLGLENASVEDCQKLRYICECISKRAAKLAAVGLSGLINKIAEPHIVVGVDGSVYRLHPHFDNYMREAMQKLVDPKIVFELMLSEDGSGRGAALVAAVASKN